MIALFNYFVKITGWLPAKIICRWKIKYEDKKVQSRRLKGPSIIISNHTSVYDYAVFLFVYFFRTLRYQMAEVLYKKKLLGLFLKCMGGIYVNRDTYDFSFMDKSKKILSKGGIVGIFPESRLPKKGESSPLPFKESAALLALETGVKIIPTYITGGYFKKKRIGVLIGKPINVRDFYDASINEKENVKNITNILRNKIIELGKLYEEK
ncbi:MAG: 1-acyl-sn-glycerol-3-phosphate acyltransferase [Erysipelotrichaceae bacterium]|nr:1-acyl-sn-glycerol-3-phosphate acyltransferase [Erysipelotrichaceae bacterium]